MDRTSEGYQIKTVPSWETIYQAIEIVLTRGGKGTNCFGTGSTNADFSFLGVKNDIDLGLLVFLHLRLQSAPNFLT